MSADTKDNKCSRVLGIIVICLYLLQVALFWHQINDDAFITFRYSKFLSLGLGPYFNIGEHVEGYTNFLMMLIMSLVIKLFGDEVTLTLAKIIDVSAGVVCIWFCWALTARLLRKLDPVARWAGSLGWLGAGLVATNSAFVVNSTSGLETTLWAAWISAGLYLLLKTQDQQRWQGAGIFFALAVLTRPEGSTVYGVVFLARLLIGEWKSGPLRRALLTDTIIVVLTCLGHLGFRYLLYDGELLPNTFYAKAAGLSWKVGTWDYLYGFVVTHLGGFCCALAILPVVIGPGVKVLQHGRLDGSGRSAAGNDQKLGKLIKDVSGVIILFQHLPGGFGNISVGQPRNIQYPQVYAFETNNADVHQGNGLPRFTLRIKPVCHYRVPFDITLLAYIAISKVINRGGSLSSG